MNIAINNSAVFNNRNITFSSKRKLMSLSSFANIQDEFIKSEIRPSNNSIITYDTFTGLRDKIALLKRFDYKRQEAVKNHKNLGIAMFDMDNFKSINELLGYEIGDIFIKTASSNVKQVTKENNLGSYRFGGDEYVVIFTNHSEEQIKNICKEIQNKLNNNPILEAYSQQYIKSAENKLEGLRDEMSYFRIFQENKIKLKQLTELAKKDSNLMNSEVFTDEITACSNNINIYLLSMLQDAVSSEKNPQIRSLLDSCIIKLEEGSFKEKTDVIFSEKLFEYLSVRFDRTAQIYQIKSWLDDYNKNGFSATCGILEVKPDKYLDESPIDLVDRVGELLKSGKHSAKGGIYVKKIE